MLMMFYTFQFVFSGARVSAFRFCFCLCFCLCLCLFIRRGMRQHAFKPDAFKGAGYFPTPTPIRAITTRRGKCKWQCKLQIRAQRCLLHLSFWIVRLSAGIIRAGEQRAKHTKRKPAGGRGADAGAGRSDRQTQQNRKFLMRLLFDAGKIFVLLCRLIVIKGGLGIVLFNNILRIILIYSR